MEGWTKPEEDQRAGPKNELEQANSVRQRVSIKSDGRAESELGDGKAGRMQGGSSRWSASGV